jgi:hypothetical protein
MISSELVHHVTQNLHPVPDMMTFTSSSTPPLSPRNIDSAAPFPFKDQPVTDLPTSVFDTLSRPGTSDHIRAVVSIGDVLQHPPDFDDMQQQGAQLLQFLSRSNSRQLSTSLKE